MAHRIEGKVVQIDDSGNLVTDIAADRLTAAPRGETTVVRCDGHETCGIHPPDHGEPEMTLLAVLPPDGSLQICIVGDSARAMLGIAPGATVTVEW